MKEFLKKEIWRTILLWIFLIIEFSPHHRVPFLSNLLGFWKALYIMVSDKRWAHKIYSETTSHCFNLKFCQTNKRLFDISNQLPILQRYYSYFKCIFLSFNFWKGQAFPRKAILMSRGKISPSNLLTFFTIQLLGRGRRWHRTKFGAEDYMSLGAKQDLFIPKCIFKIIINTKLSLSIIACTMIFYVRHHSGMLCSVLSNIFTLLSLNDVMDKSLVFWNIEHNVSVYLFLWHWQW